MRQIFQDAAKRIQAHSKPSSPKVPSRPINLKEVSPSERFSYLSLFLTLLTAMTNDQGHPTIAKRTVLNERIERISNASQRSEPNQLKEAALALLIRDTEILASMSYNQGKLAICQNGPEGEIDWNTEPLPMYKGDEREVDSVNNDLAAPVCPTFTVVGNAEKMSKTGDSGYKLVDLGVDYWTEELKGRPSKGDGGYLFKKPQKR